MKKLTHTDTTPTILHLGNLHYNKCMLHPTLSQSLEVRAYSRLYKQLYLMTRFGAHLIILVDFV